MEPEAPDVYADQFIVTIGLLGVAMSFLRMPPHPNPGQPPQPTPQAVVRTSLEHAKIIAMLLRRQLKNWERENVDIAIPHNVLNTMGLSEEDW